jgi:Ser/Thr protein kinase RdoA (MazF antagonist)
MTDPAPDAALNVAPNAAPSFAPDRAPDAEIPLAGGGRTRVWRRADVVHRETGPWAGAVHALLRHLEAEGFDAAPRVVGSGFDERGRETLSFIAGDFVHPGPWPSEQALHAIGVMLAGLHRAGAGFTPPPGATWRPWFGRAAAGPAIAPGLAIVYGHCDVAPWNIVARGGAPVALIDWEAAGPVDPMVELAQAAWLNAQLHDDDVAARCALPSAGARMRQLRAFAEGYGLERGRRRALADAMIAFAIASAAAEATDAGFTPSGGPADAVWGVVWRTRAAAWMARNRALLDAALA